MIKMNPHKFLFGMLLVCLCFFSLCTGNVKVDNVTCLGEGKGGGGFVSNMQVVLDCCQGLKKISEGMGVDTEGKCQQALDAGFVCAKCGDGRCGIGENKCNCPSDCSASCANEGESVFDNLGMGPVKCCNADSGIEPLTHIDSTYNICSDSDPSGSKGVCSESWSKTCGNGVCDPGEDKCNCLQDCPPAECAKDGEQVYSRSIDGPVRCCNANSGIKYDHRLENGACTAVSGQFSPIGACVEGWQKTCGDGTCGSGEDRCNCPQDCSSGPGSTMADSNCANVGETINTPLSTDRKGPTACCAGLTPDDGYMKSDAQGDCPKPIPHPLPAMEICIKCGDGVCGSGENKCNCPQDCGEKNRTNCAGEGENAMVYGCCPGLVRVMNSWVIDENGVCQGFNMPTAICTKCGDRVCGKGENKCNCPSDCVQPKTDCLSDRDCVSDGGTCHMCFNKAWFLGDDIQKRSDGFNCQGIGDSLCYCKQGICTVTSICGDGACGIGENPTNCPKDCGTKGGDECKDSSDCVVAINLNSCCNCPQPVPKTLIDGKASVVYEKGKDYSSMLSTDCKNVACAPCRSVYGAICYSGKCAEAPLCGNGFCEAGENETSCSLDCRSNKAVCGNSFCETGENPANCPYDCGSKKPVCGNGFCEESENTANCPPDCPKTQSPTICSMNLSLKLAQDELNECEMSGGVMRCGNETCRCICPGCIEDGTCEPCSMEEDRCCKGLECSPAAVCALGYKSVLKGCDSNCKALTDCVALGYDICAANLSENPSKDELLECEKETGQIKCTNGKCRCVCP